MFGLKPRAAALKKLLINAIFRVTRKIFMVKKCAAVLPFIIVVCTFSFMLICSSPSQSPEKPRLSPMPDIHVFATDTVALIADPIFAPAVIRCYAWSSDGGKTFPESTTVNSSAHHWQPVDTGVHRMAVKIIDSRGIVSDSIVFNVIVEICRPTLSLITDTSFIDFSTITNFRVTNISNCRRILAYMWSFDGGASFPDTTQDSAIIKKWSITDTGTMVRVLCRAMVLPGVVSPSAFTTVHIGYCRPNIRLSGSTVIRVGDTTRFFIVSNAQCPAAFYLWSFNNGNSFTDTTHAPTILKRWNLQDTTLVRVVAAVKTSDGIQSIPDTLRLFSTPCTFSVHLSGDSSALAGDSSRFTITAVSSCSPILWYLYSFNGGSSFSDTLHMAVIAKYWNISDTGTRLVFAKAQTASGEYSVPDSCKIIIRSSFPKVSLPPDTSLTAGDTFIVIAQIDSGHRPIAFFAWTVDHAAQAIMTIGNSFAFYRPVENAGNHTLSVRAVDVKGFSSTSDSMTITSVAITPTLKIPRDTLIKRKDTLIAVVGASVAGGSIKQYLWNVGSSTWTDSGTAPQTKIVYQGKDTLTVLVGARDNRGSMKIDSFHVFFNAPPADLHMAFPRLGDTIIFRNIDSTYKHGAVHFRFSATDKNGIHDTLTYKLSLGTSPGGLATAYEGRDTVWTNTSPLDTSHYYWTLTVKDRLGDSAQISGGFTCLLQQTLCFAGHSIIVGFGDSVIGMGGMRGRILPVIRSRRGGTAKVKPLGPLSTGFMADKTDDSCFAVSSYRARDLYLLMKNSFPALNADMWVVMLGVNDAYSYNYEFRQLLWIIDTIHAHNPQAYTYVINGLPYQGAFGQDKVFNGWLADSLKSRKAVNPSWNVWNIDAFKKFTLADSTTPNPALFFPETPYVLHPNAAGYDTLSKMILDTMKLKFP